MDYMSKFARSSPRIDQIFKELKSHEPLYKAAKAYNDGNGERPNEAQVRNVVNVMEAYRNELSQAAEQARKRLATAIGCKNWNNAVKMLLVDKQKRERSGTGSIAFSEEALNVQKELADVNNTNTVAALYINALKRSINALPGYDYTESSK